jgi:catechol 2,3-dioxygenase-like lactoylglutathione lyase family enzyme
MNTEFPRMHVSLYVKNIEKTVEFYQNFFNQEATKVKAGYAKFTLDKPSLVISFVENAKNITPLFWHLGFQIDTEEELTKRLEAAKLLKFDTLEETGTACCYAKQDKFWVMDPDGYRWEVYLLHEDVEFNDPQYQTEAEACCSPNMVVEPTPVAAEPCCDPASGCC